MQFSTVATVAAVAAVASASYNETATVFDNSTTIVTITSCEENKCSTTTSAALISTATTTVEGVVTEYTTYCPLTSETTAAPVTVSSVTEAQNTTSHTVTSQSENGAAKALPAVGALMAGAAALLL
ncbi:hypothetical protein ACO0RG_002540 [Hanseniaspora osmophila]|uniref:Covalently-linked cell wall protein 12 n=1 Tax=Hanseniaspora osmophila TaxID=56408 RepID=A0A1E5RW00_9ASCO|nr:Covalently-linked cell wall protein 12 [Hanseniaspora osmophila]